MTDTPISHPSAQKKIAVFSKGIAKKTSIAKLLNATLCYKPSPHEPVDAVVGWGRKANTAKAMAYAKQHQLDYYQLEDGFIHSLGQGVLGYESYSLVKDKQGIYYDAHQASDLEQLILEQTDDEAGIQRAQKAIQCMVDNHISKYNNAPLSVELPSASIATQGRILLVDQTAGDLSLQYGHVTQHTFADMLNSALKNHPKAHIIIKTHPDVLVGKKQGCFDLSITGEAQRNPRVSILSHAINPIALLKQVDEVYVATSQLGFEALMVGKPVHCFAMPFYAGWGLTHDTLTPPTRRNKTRRLEQVFLAAYCDYTNYLHPDTQQPCELEALLDWFALQYRYYPANTGKIFCFGFSFWKRSQYTRRFLQAPNNEVIFSKSAKQAIKQGFNADSQIVVWASKGIEHKLEALLAISKQPLIRMEDGFLRSTGLGSDFTAPASLVLDRQGIYYNPQQQSDLEELLQTHAFSHDEKQRGKQLRQRLLDYQLSKYNVGTHINREKLAIAEQQTVILIPGQVEDDASIRQGCIDINSNAELIELVRLYNPNAYIIYKPHPDVVSGNRLGKVSKNLSQQHCNSVLDDCSITDCLAIVDEVHTMTSLVGFEALLRNKKVYCYGIPFYASWGLTEDRHTCIRRTRDLSLDELVAATYILYPRYINWQTKAFTTPEFIADQLNQSLIQQGGKRANKKPWLSRWLQQVWAIINSKWL